MNELIVIVEDEVATAEILADYLRLENYNTYLLTDGSAVVSWVREHKPALILLDLMLPSKGGLDICKEIRSFSTVPIIMTTARVEEIDRLLGLELGADDYICKPYSPREVVARVKTVLRRSGNLATIQEAVLLLDESCYRATLNGHDLQLMAAEFRLLNYLAAHPGRVYNRQQLLNNIYPDDRILNDRAIDNYDRNSNITAKRYLRNFEQNHCRQRYVEGKHIEHPDRFWRKGLQASEQHSRKYKNSYDYEIFHFLPLNTVQVCQRF